MKWARLAEMVLGPHGHVASTSVEEICVFLFFWGGGLGSCARPVWISLQSLVQDVPNMPFNFLFDTAMVALVSLFDGIVT